MTRRTENRPECFGDGWNCSVAKAMAEKWLDENEGAIVYFCTNTMLSRGTVYRCKIVNRRAIAVGTQSWWAMSYSELVECNEDLGYVKPIQRNGDMFFTLGVFKDGCKEHYGPRLKVGRG